MKTKMKLMLLVVAIAVIVGASMNPVSAAMLTLDETVEVSFDKSEFNISVYPGKASYSGTNMAGDAVTGVFGDGTVTSYRFFTVNAEKTALISYADDAGIVAPVVSPPEADLDGSESWANVWTTTDPGVDFATAADITENTLARAMNITGTIDISALSSGTVYVIFGGIKQLVTLTLTMSGTGQTDIQAEYSIQLITTNAGKNHFWVSSFDFADAGGYDTITYNYTIDGPARRGRFVGVIIDEVVSDANRPFVNAGANMISWSGQAVQLDPNVVETPGSNWTNLTYLWTAKPDEGVVISNANIEEPNVTIIPPATVTTAITVANAGFEDPVLGNGSWTETPAAWTEGHYDVTDPGVWVVGDGAAGAYNPSVTDGFGGLAPEGENVMYITAGVGYDKGMSQVLSAKLEANTQYNLSVLVGNPFLFNGNTATADYRIELVAGGVVLASDTGPSPADDTTWTTAELTYDSGDNPAQLGEALEIRLVAVNFTDVKELDFDDVQLIAEGPPPNPYTVRCILAVNNEGNPPEDAVKDVLEIDVYDDACQAARVGKSLGSENPGDFNGDCITDGLDLDELAEKWLANVAITAPIPKP